MIDKLLDRCGAFAPEFGGGLSNHLPMALVALERLGATDTRLEAFFAGYVTRLEPLSTHAVEEDSATFVWPDRLGNIEGYQAAVRHFSAWLDAEPMDEVLAECLPQLARGIGAAAFHGLIRTAYAIEAGHRDELARGLAYWASRFLPMSAESPRAGTMRPAQWLARVMSTPPPTGSFDLIFAAMQDVARSDAFQAALGDLLVDTNTVHEFSEIAMRSYVKSRNFVVLHLVTSAHALRILLRFVANQDEVVRQYAMAYAAAWLAATPQMSPSAEAPLVILVDWPDITQRAMQSHNDHVIKLVYSCVSEHRASASALAGAVARIAVA
jgi:hypothetical protein